jgi:hypothetical protein
MADDDDVVAAVRPTLVAALEMRGRADQYRCAAFGDDVVDLGEFVLVRAGKFIRQLDLGVCQYIDDKMRALLERRQALCISDVFHSTSGGLSETQVKELAVIP